MTKAHRAPSGAVAVAAQVRALVRDVGARAAGQVLGISQGRAAALARASENRNVGNVFHTVKGLDAWRQRVEGYAKLAPPDVARVIRHEKQPEQHARASTKTGRQHQTEAGIIKAQYSDGAIAKAAGISRQKATAIRLQLAKGAEPKAKDRAKFDAGVERLIERHGVRDGIHVVSKDRALAVLDKMTPKERAEHSADKRFTNWADLKNWVDGIAGAPSSMVHVYNTGTASAPAWSVVIAYDDTDDSYDDDAFDDEYYDEQDGEEFDNEYESETDE